MKLLTKFNLIMVVLFGLGGFLIPRLAYRYMIENARREVLQEAELMMESARSVRDYTSNNLAPLLKQTVAHKTRFVPETTGLRRDHNLQQAAPRPIPIIRGTRG
jgi:hypothetical protein